MPKPVTAKISATVNDGALSAEGIRIELGVNSFPMVSATILENSSGTVTRVALSGDVVSRIAKLQEERLAGRVTPDFNLEAEDGIGGKISYQGFVSAPILDISSVSTSEKIASVGRAALLDSLDLSVYDAGYTVARLESSATGSDERQLRAVAAAKRGDVAGTLLGVTDVLVENFANTLAKEVRPLPKQLLEIQHAINTGGPLALWRGILNASSVTFKSWEKIEKSAIIAAQLTESVKQIITSRTPGFWNIVRALQSHFQMYYVPELDNTGRFERADKKITETDVTMELSATSISLSDGSPRILQPGGVVMVGAATPGLRAESTQSGTSRIMAYAPDPLLPGFIQQEPVPFWLVRGVGIPILGSEVDTRSTSTATLKKVDLSLANRRARVKKGLAYKREVDDVREGVMTELCEVMFKEIQLAHSTAEISTPLDFSLNEYLGQRVKVKIRGKNQSDGGSFSAFVAGIRHGVDLRSGKQLDSSTQVSLTHAKFI